jgi:hypothetical protein
MECGAVFGFARFVLTNWPKRGSNPHEPYGSRDFKSRASANSAIRPFGDSSPTADNRSWREGVAGRGSGIATVSGARAKLSANCLP